MTGMTEEEIGRITEALRTAVRLSGVSHRVIEREMGLSTGYLSRIFGGKVELRVRHVLEVCRVLDMPPDSFFQAVFPRRLGPMPGRGKMMGGLRELNPAPYPVDPSTLMEGPPDGDDSRKALRELLRKLRQLVDEYSGPPPGK